MAAKEEKPVAPPKVKRMDDLAGVLAEMKAVYRSARRGEIKPGDGTKLVYMLREVRETYHAVHVEERVKRLEALLDG